MKLFTRDIGNNQVLLFSLLLFVLVIAAYRYNINLLYVAAFISILLSIIPKRPLLALIPYFIIITWGAEVWDEAYSILYTIVKESILAVFFFKCYQYYKPRGVFKVLSSILIFLVYCLLAEMFHDSNGIEPMKILNLGICYFAIYLCSRYGNYQDLRSLSLALSLGVLLSGLMALVAIVIPPLFEVVQKMIQTTNEFDMVEISTGRFAAMTYDPNQFGLYTLIPLTTNIAIIIREKYSKVGMELLMVIGLLVFGALTLSKSVIGFLVLLLFYFVMYTMIGHSITANKKVIWSILFVVLAVVAISEMSIYIGAMKMRFSDSTSLSSATTGRSDIWIRYIDLIFGDIRILFFGNSLIGRIPNYSTPHNFILYMLFFFGIVGIIIYLIMIKHIIDAGKVKGCSNKIPFYYKIPIVIYFLFCLTIDPFMLYDVKLALIGVSLICLTSGRKINFDKKRNVVV